MRLSEYLRQRYKAILRYTGLVWTIIGLLTLAPLLGLVFYWDERGLAWGLMLPGLTLALVGLVLWRGLSPPEDVSLTTIEGSVIIVLAWLAATTVGSIPFMLVGDLGFATATFESTSGWTTTGLSVVDVTRAPRLLLLHRSVMQLAGGAGFAIIVLATLTGPSGVALSSAEGREQQLAPHVRQSAAIVLRIYAGYVVFGIVGLRLAGMDWFDAVNHAFAALSTGGFSTRPESIGYWNSSLVEGVIIVLMVMGTTNFLTSYALLQGKFKDAIRSSELRFFGLLLLIFVPVLFLGAALGLYPQLGKSLRVALFEVVSAASTTGFSSVAYGDWPGLGLLVLMVLMLIGGGAGSTAGGIKQYRVLVLLRAVLWEIQRWFLPRSAVGAPAVWQAGERRVLSDSQIRKDSTFIALYLSVYLIGSAVITAHGYSLADSLFEFASSVGTVGLSVGITSAGAPAGVLFTQIAGMILGRLEFFAFIVGVVKLLSDVPDMLKRPQREPEILMRQGHLQPGRFTILVPVASADYGEMLGRIANLLARGSGGQVLALTVIKVPPILNPLAGRFMLRDKQPLVDIIADECGEGSIPVQVMVRSTRSIPDGIRHTMQETGSDLALFGWPRPRPEADHAFSSVVDPIIANPPCDIAVLRYRPFDQLRTVMVPVSGRPNERLAVRTAVQLTRGGRKEAIIRLVHVAHPDVPEAELEERAEHVYERLMAEIPVPYKEQIIRANSAAQGILRAAEMCDMVVMGATKEPLFHNLLLGNVAQTVAEQAPCPVIIVKRRSSSLRSVLRDTVLRPVPRSSKQRGDGHWGHDT